MDVESEIDFNSSSTEVRSVSSSVHERVADSSVICFKLRSDEIDSFLGIRMNAKDSRRYKGVFPVSESLGEFRNGGEYIDSLSLLLASTDETSHRKAFLKQLIEKRVKCLDCLLEVGVGTAEVSAYISESFKRVTFVDNNPNAFSQPALKKLSPAVLVENIYDSILNFQLRRDYYDAVIMSHLLYYIDSSLWDKCINKIFNSLKESGLLVVVLSGKGDKSFLANQFKGEDCNLDLPVDLLVSISEGNSVEVYDMEEVCEVSSLDEALHVASIYLDDAGTSASKSDLVKHLNAFNRVNNAYRFEFTQRFVILQR